jgi:hypothetical protein
VCWWRRRRAPKRRTGWAGRRIFVTCLGGAARRTHRVPGSSGLLSFCNAPVQFSGLAPGFVGLYQVNVQIPAGAMSGSIVPLQITFAAGAGRPSNIVTIAVE